MKLDREERGAIAEIALAIVEQCSPVETMRLWEGDVRIPPVMEHSE